MTKMTNQALVEEVIRRKPRSPCQVAVNESTEWSDFHGIQLLFGLRRSTAYHLSNEGLIQSVSLKENGERRGKRLFSCSSIRAYLNSKLQYKEPAVTEKGENSLEM